MVTFRDLKFKKRGIGGVGASHTFENGITISVQAGIGNYSTPKKDLKSPNDYVSFEVGLWGEGGDWVTKDFIPDANDDVVGWQDRGEINTLMLLIQSTKS